MTHPTPGFTLDHLTQQLAHAIITERVRCAQLLRDEASAQADAGAIEAAGLLTILADRLMGSAHVVPAPAPIAGIGPDVGADAVAGVLDDDVADAERILRAHRLWLARDTTEATSARAPGFSRD